MTDGETPRVIPFQPAQSGGESAGFSPPFSVGAVPPTAPSPPLAPPPPTTPQPPAAPAPSSPRLVGRDLYLKIRAAAPHYDHELALGFLVKALTSRRDRLPASAPPADEALLRLWAAQDEWEQRHESSRTIRTLHSHALSQNNALVELRNAERAAKDLYDDAVVRASPDPRNPNAVPPAAAYEKARSAWRLWVEAREELRREEDSARRRELEGQRSDSARERIEHLTQVLISQYDGLGPQYELMCRSLAEVRVRREQVSQSGRDITSDEFAKLAELEIRIVGQIQKHTEATKSESLSKEAKEMALAVLRHVERVVAPRNPRLWRDVVQEVKAQLGTENAAPQLPRAPLTLVPHRTTETG